MARDDSGKGGINILSMWDPSVYGNKCPSSVQLLYSDEYRYATAEQWARETRECRLWPLQRRLQESRRSQQESELAEPHQPLVFSPVVAESLGLLQGGPCVAVEGVRGDGLDLRDLGLDFRRDEALAVTARRRGSVMRAAALANGKTGRVGGGYKRLRAWQVLWQ